MMCLFCVSQKVDHGDYMLVCSDQTCRQAAHGSCLRDKKYDTPRGMRTRDALLNAARDWFCPVCQYGAYVFDSKEPDVPTE